MDCIYCISKSFCKFNNNYYCFKQIIHKHLALNFIVLNKIEMVYLSTWPKDIFSFGFGVPSSYQKKEQVHNIEIPHFCWMKCQGCAEYVATIV